MSKKELIKKFVETYYAQVSVVEKTDFTLEQYLRSIMQDNPEYTEEDIKYGLSLKK